MTFIGKLLVVLQLVLTVCFMAFAGAVFSYHTNWRNESVRLQSEVKKVADELKTEKDRLNGTITKLTETKKLSDDEAIKARSEQAEVTKKADALTNDVARLNTDLTLEINLRKSAQQEASIRREEAKLLTEINDTLNKELNQKNTVVRAQEDDIFNKAIEIKSLTDKYTVLLETVATFTKVLATNGFSTDPKSYAKINAPTELVYGLVIESDPKAKGGRELVQISIGSDDGLTVGTTLFVYRVGDRGKFLGQIKLVLVKPDESVGVLLAETKNGVIERGDHVSTKLGK